MTRFNPCFNGTMYKNPKIFRLHRRKHNVSILVLMELCIKTPEGIEKVQDSGRFNPCFNGTMYKNLH